MVCKVCHEMLFKHKGRKESGSKLHLSFKHHAKAKHLHDSARGCYLCRVTRERLEHLKIQITDDDERAGQFLTASLRPSGWQRRATGLYLLDFKIEKRDLMVASFVLKQNDGESLANVHARPISSTTGDPEVMQMAKDWITECLESHEKCRLTTTTSPAAAATSWYPNRLLDLQPMLDSGGATEVVRLVSQKTGETRPDQAAVEGSYVTLSHRWGEATLFKLTKKTLDRFLTEGVPLRDLPLLFQDAVKVARELGVRWLWIDALCIVQEEKDLKDWLEESATMEKVYAHSYCNISATAAIDSTYGLFNKRDMQYKWVENITLNIKDLGGSGKGRSQERVECAILDLSFWEKYVDNSPVNRRSWVYQERLLAPRVLHWCQDQIAFECREMSRAECRPEGLPHFRMKSGVLIDGVRLKSLDLDAGKQLRAVREASMRGKSINSKAIQKMVDEIEPKFHLYELWKHWVEVYTKMELTNARDRLIALSGIARMMSSRMKDEGFEDRYIAGMWQKYMASQLLWFVNEGKGKDRQPFEDTRPKEYRAPSFSWASVETPRGVNFAETKDPQDPRLLVRIEVVRLSYRTEDDKFGLLTDGYLVLTGVLRKIELTDSMMSSKQHRLLPSKKEGPINWDHLVLLSLMAGLMPWIVIRQFCLVTLWWAFGRHRDLGDLYEKEKKKKVEVEENVNAKDKNRYSWRLVQDGRPVGKDYQIVYLDSPASEPSIFGPDAQVYCLPALKEDRYLTCLLLQATDGEYGMRYKRVGLTKVSALTPDLIHTLTTAPGHNETALGRYYWGPDSRMKGESTICIV